MIVPRMIDENSCKHCLGAGEVINQRQHQVVCPVCNGTKLKPKEEQNNETVQS